MQKILSKASSQRWPWHPDELPDLMKAQLMQAIDYFRFEAEAPRVAMVTKLQDVVRWRSMLLFQNAPQPTQRLGYRQWPREHRIPVCAVFFDVSKILLIATP